MSRFNDVLDALRAAGMNEGQGVLYGIGDVPHLWERELRARGFGTEADIVARVKSQPSTPAVGPQPPAGRAPLRTSKDWEALPSHAEQLNRMDELDQLLAEGK